MKNKRILLLLFCALLGLQVGAQRFETSTATNPKWYFIQVNGIGDNVDKVLTELNGQVTGQQIETGLAAKAKQLWRFEEITTTQFHIVSNSGKNLDIVYDAALNKRIAVLTETPSTVWTSLAYGSVFYLQVVTPPSGGVANERVLILGDNNLVYFDKLTNDNSRFKFISFDMPIISSDEEIAWTALRSAKASLSDQCVTEEDNTASDIKLSMQSFAPNNHRQQWKLIQSAGNIVNFVNRATGHAIATTPVFNIYNYVQYIPAAAVTDGWTLAPIAGNQYEVYTGPANAGKYWNAATDTEDRAEYQIGASQNTGFAWIFSFVEAEFSTTDIYTPELLNGAKVYARDKRIYVEGADSYQVYTLYGVRVNSDRELPAGVYLVNVQGKTTKVLVK